MVKIKVTKFLGLTAMFGKFLRERAGRGERGHSDQG